MFGVCKEDISVSDEKLLLYSKGSVLGHLVYGTILVNWDLRRCKPFIKGHIYPASDLSTWSECYIYNIFTVSP